MGGSSPKPKSIENMTRLWKSLVRNGGHAKTGILEACVHLPMSGVCRGSACYENIKSSNPSKRFTPNFKSIEIEESNKTDHPYDLFSQVEL